MRASVAAAAAAVEEAAEAKKRAHQQKWARQYSQRTPEKIREGVQKWRQANSEKARECSRKSHQRRAENGYRRDYEYGLPKGTCRRLFDEQGGLCAICGDPITFNGKSTGSMHVDHDHATGEVRGLLCRECNVGLGGFKDDAERLRRALVYITGERS